MTKEDFKFFSEIYSQNHKEWYQKKFECFYEGNMNGFNLYKGLLDGNDKWYSDLKQRFENQE